MIIHILFLEFIFQIVGCGRAFDAMVVGDRQDSCVRLVKGQDESNLSEDKTFTGKYKYNRNIILKPIVFFHEEFS